MGFNITLKHFLLTLAETSILGIVVVLVCISLYHVAVWSLFGASCVHALFSVYFLILAVYLHDTFFTFIGKKDA